MARHGKHRFFSKHKEKGEKMNMRNESCILIEETPQVKLYGIYTIFLQMEVNCSSGSKLGSTNILDTKRDHNSQFPLFEKSHFGSCFSQSQTTRKNTHRLIEYIFMYNFHINKLAIPHSTYC